MPTMYPTHQAVPPNWPQRKAAWITHYMNKGCHREKATYCAEKKRFKTSWP